MKTKELRQLTEEKLEQLLKDLIVERAIPSGNSKMKEFKKKKGLDSGIKTSLPRDIRRTIAKIKTIQCERKLEEVKQNDRRTRRN